MMKSHFKGKFPVLIPDCVGGRLCQERRTCPHCHSMHSAFLTEYTGAIPSLTGELSGSAARDRLSLLSNDKQLKVK